MTQEPHDTIKGVDVLNALVNPLADCDPASLRGISFDDGLTTEAWVVADVDPVQETVRLEAPGKRRTIGFAAFRRGHVEPGDEHAAIAKAIVDHISAFAKDVEAARQRLREHGGDLSSLSETDILTLAAALDRARNPGSGGAELRARVCDIFQSRREDRRFLRRWQGITLALGHGWLEQAPPDPAGYWRAVWDAVTLWRNSANPAPVLEHFAEPYKALPDCPPRSEAGIWTVLAAAMMDLAEAGTRDPRISRDAIHGRLNRAWAIARDNHTSSAYERFKKLVRDGVFDR